MNRRTFLTLVASAVPFAHLETASAAQPTEAWPMFGYDTGNTGYRPTESEIANEFGDDVETRWKFTDTSEADPRRRAIPSLTDGLAILSSFDENVYAFDIKTGEEMWRHDMGSGGWSQAAIAGDTVYVASSTGTVFALDTATGDKRWNRSVGERIWGAPTVAGETVYVTSQTMDGPDGGFGTIHALKTNDGSHQWRMDGNGDVLGSQLKTPAVSDDFVAAVGRGGLVLVDTSTGKKFLDQEIEGEPRAAPVMKDDWLYFTVDSRLLAVPIREDGDGWSFNTNSDIWTSPVVTDDAVFFTNDEENLYALDTDGNKKWSKPSAGHIYARPVVMGDTLFTITREDVLSLDVENGETKWSVDAPGKPPKIAAVPNGDQFMVTALDGIYSLTGSPPTPTETATPMDRDDDSIPDDEDYAPDDPDVQEKDDLNGDDSSEGSGPGFGVATGIVGALSGAELLRRRQSGD